jgi:hypothetical protein
MAEIKKSVVGVISGRLDNIVFVVRNGKSYASVRPRKYKAGKSDAAKAGRNNFAITVKLAKSVNSVAALKEIWAAASLEGTDSYHRVIKFNAKRVKGGSLTTSNKITPDGLAIKLTTASIENKILHLSFLCPPETNLKFPARVFIYLYFEKAEKSIIRFFTTIAVPSPDNVYTLDITLDSHTKKIAAEDSEPIIYLALVGGTPFKKKVYWTSTASIKAG